MIPSRFKQLGVILPIIILVALIVVRYVNINSRSQLHSDEIFSVMLARHNMAYVTPLPADTVLTGEQIKHNLLTDNSLGEDIAGLYTNNLDAPHASLYYMTLRVALIGQDGFDAADVAYRGGVLNILFFIVSFIAVWRLSRRLFVGKYADYIIAAVLCVAFGNAMAIQNTLLVREYQMAEMFICLFTYASVIITSNISEHIKTGWKTWLCLSLTIAGCISTGYLNSVYVAFVLLCMSLLAIGKKQPRAILCFLGAGVAAVAVSFLIYNGYFNFLTHSTIHTERAFASSKGVMALVFKRALIRNGLSLIGIIVLAGVFALALCGKDRNKIFTTRVMWWLPVAAMATMCLIEYASVLKALRYVYPFVPVAALTVGIGINALKPRYGQIVAIFFAVYMLMRSFFIPVVPDYGWTQRAPYLSRGAVMYALNPNELPQVAPMLNDTAHYYFASTPAALASHYKPIVINDTTTRQYATKIAGDYAANDIPIVSRVRPQGVNAPVGLVLTGPLKLSGVIRDVVKESEATSTSPSK